MTTIAPTLPLPRVPPSPACGGGLGWGPSRRAVLLAAAGFSLVPSFARSAAATPAAMDEAIRTLVGEATVTPGKVKLELPPIVENGNTVSLTVSVDSPMTEAEHIASIHLFNEKNPQPYIAAFHLGPRAGKAAVSTRIRLADSQRVVAIARLSDGSFWSDSADVIVTLAACAEG
jgi:sulfur-oxidizing protein SoxY